MRYVLYILKVIIYFGLAMVLLYGLAVLVGGLLPASFGSSQPATGEEHIYLLNTGYHVEICLPADEAPEPLVREIYKISDDLTELNSPAYYCFGWGDRSFYPGTPSIKDLNIVQAVRTALLPTRGAMRISWYFNDLKISPSVQKIPATPAQIERLYKFVTSSYLYDSQADIKLVQLPDSAVDPEFEPSIFIEAVGTYSLIYTCNNWTSEALKKAGIPTKIWTPTVWGVGK
jgi:uncharacterized protein (TIGR02117 family)